MYMLRKNALWLIIACLSSTHLQAQFISEENAPGAFAVVSGNSATAIYVDSSETFLVRKAATFLQSDIMMVTGRQPVLLHRLPASGNVIIIGTAGSSAIIGRLIAAKKLDAGNLRGKWETYRLQVVEKPFTGAGAALVIAGSDRRGTAYGIFELSRQMGVSPWYWWADVPVKQKKEVYVRKGAYLFGPPSVKYRGFFINDEAPAFSGWTKEKFGGVNHRVYEKVFELLLRLKANYLWPAMWGNAFNDDDTLNPKLADAYGIVMGTSHHEPMLRAQQEWKRYGKGLWNYERNKDTLQAFWKKGIEHMGTHESIVTIGMRGDGDEPMTQGTAINLLENIVKDQRGIIEKVTAKPPAATPQLWALYKEVQDYYDQGMRVPDDVTLLLCDDNWGNIRKLPKPGEKPRAGGYGIYYHFDYVGGPRNYKWLNTIPIARTWEQMHLADQYKANQIWIVNVGDIKPLEFPTSFFLDYAWNTGNWPAERLDEYTRLWAEEQFGKQYATAIANILTKYTLYNSRRKPELLSPETYSLVNYREAETVVADYNNMVNEANAISDQLPAVYRDAFYQLVLYPVQACANLNELYFTIAENRLFAKQQRARTNVVAQIATQLFLADSIYAAFYNHMMAGGKWNHMMDQTHIGYTYWQQPPVNVMPAVTRIQIPAEAAMGMAIEGSEAWWPNETGEAALPEFDVYNKQSHYIEIFNRGKAAFDFNASTLPSWLHITPAKGTIEQQQRLWITVDWQKAPSGRHRIPINITGTGGSRVQVMAVINNPSAPKPGEVTGFMEGNGYVSIEAEHYTHAITASPVTWQRIANIGRTGAGITPFPVTAPSIPPGGNSPRLEYRIYTTDTGAVKVQVYCSPSLNFNNDGLRYGISFDDDTPQVMNLQADKSNKAWEQTVADNINITISTHHLAKPGTHVLKFWMTDPGVVLQKVVVDLGGVQPSYLGPPESFHR